MAADQWLEHRLVGMRLVNRRTGEYVGACPHCRAGRDRYHIWTQPGARGRPAGRYWCRACGASGLLSELIADREHDGAVDDVQTAIRPHTTPLAAHIPQYRQLYELTALRAHRWLLDDSSPEPLEFLARRGVTREVAERHMLGYALHDEQALVAFLTEHGPELMPYAEEAGLLVTDRHGVLRTHWNLCGALLFPTLAQGTVTDLTLWPAQAPGSNSFDLSAGGTEYFLSSNAADEATRPVSGTGGPHTSDQLIVWTLANTSSLNSSSPALNLTNKVLTVGQYGVPPK